MGFPVECLAFKKDIGRLRVIDRAGFSPVYSWPGLTLGQGLISFNPILAYSKNFLFNPFIP
ncbi:MAG: hypothetical protein ABII26_11565 [Pseudomonadota bacterium]